MNLVSIIMPVYNVEDYLEKAINSAVNQRSKNWELILVNDGSSDQSGAICDYYAGKFPEKITVLHQNNQGSGPARNSGLSRASGNYVYFADPDDFFAYDLVEDSSAILEKTGAEILVFGYIEEKNGSKEEYLPNIPQLTNQKMFRSHFRNFYQHSPYALWNKIYKRNFLLEKDIQFGAEKLGQDALFNMAVFENLNTVSVKRESYYQYLAHGESSVNRYREDRFDLELKVAENFEELMRSWSREEEFVDLIKQNYWNALYTGLASAAHLKSPLTREERVLQVQLQLQNEQIQYYVDEDVLNEETNPFRKKLLKLVLNQEIGKAVKVMAFRNQFSRHFSSLFGLVRKPILSRSKNQGS